MLNIAQKIKEQITMIHICEKYGISLDHKGFAKCPFHNEKTPSFKVYSADKGWHCFGCNESGSVIDFVMKYFNLSFKEAVKKIDLDFNLCLLKKPTIREYRQMQFAEKKRQIEKEKQESEQMMVESEYWAIFDEWKRLDENKRLYAPKSFNEEMHPLFLEAISKIEHQKYLLEQAELRRWKRENGRNSGNDDTRTS